MSDQHMPPLRAEDSSINDSTPADMLRALLERAELSQRGAARLLGVDERTMRMWCAGQGVAPTSVYRALDPRLTFSEHLRERIEQNERLIDSMENGRLHEIPRDYRPSDEKSTEREIHYLRKRNETYRSVLRLDETFHRMQDAHTVVIQQWLTPGSFGLTLADLQAFDSAEQEFQAAKMEMGRIVEQIRKTHPLGMVGRAG